MPAANLISPLLDRAAAAELLNVSPQLVGAMIRRGELPVVRVGGRFTRLRREDIDAYIEARLDRAGG
jgi:excisionase family DNA binding protein